MSICVAVGGAQYLRDGGQMSERTEGVFYNYEKQRNLETNHPNRNQYPFGHRHYAWIEFVPLSDEFK